jgi:hypothetical protein
MLPAGSEPRLGRELHMLVNLRGTFGATTMRNRQTRVQTLPPDHSAVDVRSTIARA